MLLQPLQHSSSLLRCSSLVSATNILLVCPVFAHVSAANVTPHLVWATNGSAFTDELKVGQKLRVSTIQKSSVYNSLWDEQFMPKGIVVVTTPTLELWKRVEDWFKNADPPISGPPSRVLCVEGPSGTGKSTAIRIVAAEFCRKHPEVFVFHFRNFSLEDCKTELDRVRQLSETEKVVLFADQIDSKEAHALNKKAGYNVWVVMVSSANVPFFREADSVSSQNGPKQHFCFAFSSTRTDIEAVCSLHKESHTVPRYERVVNVTTTLREATLWHTDFTQTGDEKDLSDICTWVNGHLLSFVYYLKHGAKGLAEFEAKTVASIRGKFEKDLHFYLLVMEMFGFDGKHVSGAEELKLPGAVPDRTDARYFHRQERKVFAPMFVAALLRALKLFPPPPSLFTRESSDFVKQDMNASQLGFAVERHCLQDEHLAKVAEDAAKLLGKRISVESPVRVTFHDMEDLRRAIHRRLQQQDGKSWALHAIPLAWNYSHVDAIQLYYSHAEDQSQLLVLGNQVTISTAQKHHASVLWLGSEAQALVSAVEAAFHGKPSPGITVALVFCCRVNTPENRLYLGRSLWNSLPKNPNVIAFSVAALLDSATIDLLEWEQSDEVLAAQKLELIDKRTCKCRQSRQHQQGLFCSTKICGRTTCSEEAPDHRTREKLVAEVALRQVCACETESKPNENQKRIASRCTVNNIHTCINP